MINWDVVRKCLWWDVERQSTTEARYKLYERVDRVIASMLSKMRQDLSCYQRENN